MKDFKQRLSILSLAAISVLVLAVAPAYAHQGSDYLETRQTATLQPETDTPGSQSVGSDTNTETENETEKPEVHDRVLEFRSRAKTFVQQHREGKTAMGIVARQKVCENHQKAINNKLAAFNNHASTYLNRLDTAFTKIKAYHDTNNVAATNYDALLTTATAKQTAATNAVAALKDLGTTVSCSADDPAASLATVKESASATRDALKAYRTSLKDLVVALAQATKTDSTTEETN